MLNVILIFVLILMIASAGLYIYRAKKSGQACIGCPHAKQCGKRSGCFGEEQFNEEK